LPDDVRKAIPAAKGLTSVPVRSAADMHIAVMKHVGLANVVIMNAAVADYTPARKVDTKLKKSKRALVLRLKATVDILAKLGQLERRRRKKLVLIGFALETGTGATEFQREKSRLSEARRKLRTKNLDAIVLDTPSAMGAEQCAFTVVLPGGEARHFAATSKARFARVLVNLAEGWCC
jgi:phosphopantothenoylcysteine decarboxylase/phosphopantothenate--cysteine ligase